MKQLFVIAMLVLGMSVMSAQDDNSIIFLAEFVEITQTSDWEDSELLPVTGSNIFISVAGDSEYNIIITNKFGDKFKTYNETVITGMNDGHECTYYMYDAIDQDNQPCEVLIRYFEDGHTWGEKYRYNFRIFYNNMWYGYYANPYDPDTPKSLGNKNTKEL